MRILIPLCALFAVIAAADLSRALFFREHNDKVPCSEHGMKDCGTGCIDASLTCCPDGGGGCSKGKNCEHKKEGEEGNQCTEGEGDQGGQEGKENKQGEGDKKSESTKSSKKTAMCTSPSPKCSTSSTLVSTATVIPVPASGSMTSTTSVIPSSTIISSPGTSIKATTTGAAPTTTTGGAESRLIVSRLYAIGGLVSGFFLLQSLI
jgi:hypothetical protein